MKNRIYGIYRQYWLLLSLVEVGVGRGLGGGVVMVVVTVAPSLPQQVNANSIFSGPITHLLSVLCVLITIFLHASAKKKKND